MKLPRIEIGTFWDEDDSRQVPMIYPDYPEGQVWPETMGDSITYISIEEHEQLLAEARTKAFNEAADSVEMIVGENDGHGISIKEVWDRAQSIRNKK